MAVRAAIKAAGIVTLAGIVLLVVVAAINAPEDKPLPVVKAALNYLPGDVIVKNAESGPLKNCTITLNDEFALSPVTIEGEGIYPTEMFAHGTTRFNAQTTVVTSLSLICDSPRGRVGGSRTYNPGL